MVQRQAAARQAAARFCRGPRWLLPLFPCTPHPHAVSHPRHPTAGGCCQGHQGGRGARPLGRHRPADRSGEEGGHRWCTGGVQVVNRWCTGGTQVVHRWCRGSRVCLLEGRLADSHACAARDAAGFGELRACRAEQGSRLQSDAPGPSGAFGVAALVPISSCGSLCPIHPLCAAAVTVRRRRSTF